MDLGFSDLCKLSSRQSEEIGIPDRGQEQFDLASRDQITWI